MDCNKYKTCPGCGNAVVKSGGCNHMTCRCGQKFCWLCGGPVGNSHMMAGHGCNRYPIDEQKKPTKPAVKGPTSKDKSRYIHYCERYHYHSDSLQKEILLQGSQKHFMFTQSTSRPNGDENWVFTGYEKLLQSRRVLMYTYPFAFYMFGDELADNDLTNKEIKQDLFEDQQQQLECCVEKLSMELERDFNLVVPSEIGGLKCRVISLSGLLDKCCRNMYEVIQEELLPHLGQTEFISQYKVGKAKKINFG